MRRSLAVVLLSALGCAALVAQPTSTAIVITGARVLDVTTGRAQPTVAVVIEGDRIAAVQTQPGPLPSPASTVDGSELTLVPGLFDLVVDAAPSAWIDPDYYYALGLAHGVTAYRLVDAPLTWAIEHRRRAGSLDLLAPRLWISGPGLELRPGTDAENAAGVIPIPLDGRVRVTGTAGLEREIARAAAGKADWVHLGPSVGGENVRAAVAVARRHKLRVSAEPGETELMDLARAGVDAVIGLGPADADRHAAADVQRLARELAATRTVLVPMVRQSADAALGPSNPLLARELEMLPRRFRDDVQKRLGRGGDRAAQRAWRTRRDLVRAFVSAGGRLAVGSGTGTLGWPVPGLSVIHELQLLVESGVPIADAIRAATQQPAATLGLGDRAGRLRVGAPADFVGVTGDPSKDIRALAAIRLVVRGGELINRDDLVKQAARAASRIR